MTGEQRGLWLSHLRIHRPRTCRDLSVPRSMANVYRHCQTQEPARDPSTERNKTNSVMFSKCNQLGREVVLHHESEVLPRTRGLSCIKCLLM